MSERGVFAVDRGIWSDPDFPNEPFSEREAFLWLVSEAAWRPTKVRVGSKLIELERGQCSFSTRFMAAKFQWSEARVRRFLQRRSDMNQLLTRTDAGATQVTICKYDAFQRVGTVGDAAPTQERRTSDAKKKQGNTTSNEVAKTDERVTVLCEVLDEEHATAINDHRKLKGAKTWTPHAARLMVKELVKARDAGIEPNEASEAIIRNSWTGFEADWLLKNRRQGLRVVAGQQGPPKQSGAALMEETAREMMAERFGQFEPQHWEQGRIVDGYAHRR